MLGTLLGLVAQPLIDGSQPVWVHFALFAVGLVVTPMLIVDGLPRPTSLASLAEAGVAEPAGLLAMTKRRFRIGGGIGACALFAVSMLLHSAIHHEPTPTLLENLKHIVASTAVITSGGMALHYGSLWWSRAQLAPYRPSRLAPAVNEPPAA